MSLALTGLLLGWNFAFSEFEFVERALLFAITGLDLANFYF